MQLTMLNVVSTDVSMAMISLMIDVINSFLLMFVFLF